jgi:hypothetical protein
LAKPAKETIGSIVPVNEFTGDVNKYGIHANHLEKECP